MLCTKAFGMGIDISDIDTVYHYAPTGNLSDYVQEIGRVARDKNTNEGKKSDLIKLSVLLELFGLANYEMVGGKNNEIFVRINDPSKIKRLAQGKYKNSVLSNIEKNRRDSQLVLFNFLKKKLSNKERWNIIEQYFLGDEEYVDTILEINR